MDENRLLRALPASDRELLSPFLERVHLDRGTVLETAGSPTDHAFFLETSLAAVLSARSPQRRIGIAVVGNDGMTGLELVLNAGRAANETVVQAAGSALRIGSDALRAAIERSATLRSMFLRYVHVSMVQASQTCLSNGHASMEERLARWALMLFDRSTGNDVRVTHEFISLLMGVRRSGITVTMHMIEGKGLVRSTRGKLDIVDRAGLVALAAGFYGVCEEEYERLIDPSFRSPA